MMRNSLKWLATPQEMTFTKIARHTQAPSTSFGTSPALIFFVDMDFEDDGLQEEGQVRDRPDLAAGRSFLAQAGWVCGVRPRGAEVWEMRKLWPGQRLVLCRGWGLGASGGQKPRN